MSVHRPIAPAPTPRHVNDTRVIDAMAGYVACNECAGTSGNVRSYDRVRGIWTNGWCIRCDGDQRVFIGRRAALTSIQAKQETAE